MSVLFGQVTAGFNRDGVWRYLSDSKNGDAPSSVQALADRVERFTKSCAGFCSAAYILGLGDRHFSNLMVPFLVVLHYVRWCPICDSSKFNPGMR